MESRSSESKPPETLRSSVFRSPTLGWTTLLVLKLVWVRANWLVYSPLAMNLLLESKLLLKDLQLSESVKFIQPHWFLWVYLGFFDISVLSRLASFRASLAYCKLPLMVWLWSLMEYGSFELFYSETRFTVGDCRRTIEFFRVGSSWAVIFLETLNGPMLSRWLGLLNSINAL